MANINLDPISQEEGYPPVEKWQPPFCGDMDLLIKANGDWVHEGGVIKREKLVTLFSRILWREQDEYFLVTPVEKVRIQVEDTPFQVIRYDKTLDEQGHQVYCFYTRTNDVLTLGVDCEMRLFVYQGDDLPYVSVRHGMWASLHRNVYYQLIEEAQQVDQGHGIELQLISANKSHVIGSFSAD